MQIQLTGSEQDDNVRLKFHRCPFADLQGGQVVGTFEPVQIPGLCSKGPDAVKIHYCPQL